MLSPAQDSINSPGDDIIEGSKYHVVVNSTTDKAEQYDISRMSSNYQTQQPDGQENTSNIHGDIMNVSFVSSEKALNEENKDDLSISGLNYRKNASMLKNAANTESIMKKTNDDSLEINSVKDSLRGVSIIKEQIKPKAKASRILIHLPNEK